MIVRFWRWLLEEPMDSRVPDPSFQLLDEEVQYLREELRAANRRIYFLLKSSGLAENRTAPVPSSSNQGPISLSTRHSVAQRRAELEKLSRERMKAEPDYVSDKKKYWKKEIEVAEDKTLRELSELEDAADGQTDVG